MATMQDVAKRAQVSKATVSVVLNGREASVGIKEETRQAVLRAAQELNYSRNALAQAAQSQKHRVLAFLACAPELEFKARVLAGACEAASEVGFFVKVLHLPKNRVTPQVLNACLEHRLAGVLCVGVQEPDLRVLHTQMARSGVPVVATDDSPHVSHVMRVMSDEAGGMEQVVRLLCEMGHSRIAMISGHPDSPTSQTREAGFVRAMQRRGLEVPPSRVVHGNWDEDDTARVTRELMDAPATKRPTALACAGDQWAAVALRTLRALGLAVPTDVSVTGFGDLHAAQMVDPPLTTIAQPFEEIGAAMVRHLLKRIEAPDTPEKAPQSEGAPDEVLSTRLVLRATVAPPASPVTRGNRKGRRMAKEVSIH